MYRTVCTGGEEGGVASDIYFDAADYLSMASRTRNNTTTTNKHVQKLELSILYFRVTSSLLVSCTPLTFIPGVLPYSPDNERMESLSCIVVLFPSFSSHVLE
jgi:hypothetical protein